MANNLIAISAFVFVALASVIIGLLVTRQVVSRRGRDRFHEAIASLTDPALSRLDPGEMIEEYLARAREVLRAEFTALALMDDPGGLVRIHAAAGATLAGEAPADSLIAQVIAQGEAILVGNASAPDEPHTALAEKSGSFVGCPIVISGELRGALAAESPRRNAFTIDDIQLLRRAGERIGSAVERSLYDTLEREARDAVAEGEHRVRTLIEAAPIGIVEAAVSGEPTRWNRAAAQLLGWNRWLPGTSPASPLPDELVAAIDAAAEGRRTDRVVTRMERSGARAVDLVATVTPVTPREGMGVDGVLVLLDDVTERQQMEAHVRQAQRLEAMGRLAGGVAHGFNNLLTVILGYSEVLMRTLDEDDERRGDLEAIRTAGEQATELTQQLLSIGRKPVINPEIIDLQDRVRSLEPVLRRLASEDMDLRVVTTTESGLVRVDPTEFDQAIMNLVINARDATPDGGRVVVETRRIALRGRAAAAAGVHSGEYVMITVADTGSGMPPDVLDQCFDPFFTTKGPGKGTGIGLAAVYGTVTGAAGHVTVESEVDRGTTFRLWFPAADGSADARSRPARPAKATKRRGPVGRVLIVDDEGAVRNLARAMLEEAGHTVIEASSGVEAIVKADNNAPLDVVVSDIVMPRMRGDEMAVRLKAKYPHLRVVLMSAYTDHASEIEPDVFLRKPFALDELVGVVDDLMPRGRRAKPAAATKKAATKKAAAKKGLAKNAGAKKAAAKKATAKKATTDEPAP